MKQSVQAEWVWRSSKFNRFQKCCWIEKKVWAKVQTLNFIMHFILTLCILSLYLYFHKVHNTFSFIFLLLYHFIISFVHNQINWYACLDFSTFPFSHMSAKTYKKTRFSSPLKKKGLPLPHPRPVSFWHPRFLGRHGGTGGRGFPEEAQTGFQIHPYFTFWWDDNDNKNKNHES